MDIRRHSRFDISQEIEILFNPITKLESGVMNDTVIEEEYESYIGYTGYSGDDSEIAENDVIAHKFFGGRVAGISTSLGIVSIGVSYDTFGADRSNYVKDYLTTDAFVFSRKDGTVTTEYFYIKPSGTGFRQESGGGEAGDNNRILGSFITEKSIKVNNQKFGYGFQHYNNAWTDTFKISIPATIEEWKLQQMLNSIAVAIKGCNMVYASSPITGEYDVEYDTEYGVDSSTTNEWTSIEGYNYYTQFNGGSCSPVIRLVNIDKTTLAFNSRRNVFEVEAIILG